ncbi:hypothetical protein CAR_c14440 [Carnobacterium sp. 17-4]|nr:hypothetical protein CAR_c14440 [Carnobacterium sp. 17-4]
MSSSMILLIVLGIGAFLLQSFLGFIQIKNFGLEYSRMRKLGRVAIGRRPGKFRSGTIIMFALDKEGIIKYGRKLQGTSVIARFKELEGYDGIKLDTLTLQSKVMQKEINLTKQAIINAVETYNHVVNGEPIPEKKAPLAHAAHKMKGLTLSFSKK